MRKYKLRRSIILSYLFLKEQFKEPTAILWTIISPSLLFYLLNHTNQRGSFSEPDYLKSSSWFYSYVASSVGFFGFALYIIGRRESGFMRSFIYSRDSRIIFFLGQFLSYSCIATIYCITFYIFTKISFGDLKLIELLIIAPRFYSCFLIFCSIGLFLTFLPINFSNANTILSILSLTMVIVGAASTNVTSDTGIWLHHLNALNPLQVANKIMSTGIGNNFEPILIAIVLLITMVSFSIKYLKINPVWSRY